jgi:N-acetylglucosamine kinase-like BadF-type ATPase
MMRYFLGVDIGNTKSLALVADEAGQVVGFGAAGNGNHEVVGVEGFTSVLRGIVGEACAEAGITPDQIAGAGFGIAGFDWESDRPLMNRVISTLGLRCPYEAVNDGVIGLAAGAEQGWGVSVTAGTSSNCRGRNRQGREGRVTGNGGTFGEYGGGVELVAYALEHIGRAWSLRGPQTILTDRFVKRLGASSVEDMLEGIARNRYHPNASFAPLVFQAAVTGDQVALDGIRWISRELAGLAIGVIRQLGIERESFEVVLGGSFYNGSSLIMQIMDEQIRAVAPHARLVRLDVQPVAGAVILGMRCAGVDPAPVRPALRAGSDAMFAREIARVTPSNT